jgi:AcrR family transcriptional regulator
MTSARSDRAAEEFKAAARRVFARQGYTSTKITDITAEAGRAAGGIYRYFESKAALLKAMADDFLRARREHVVHLSGTDHTMTTEEDVGKHIAAYCRTYRAYLPEMVAIYEAAAFDPQFAGIRQQIRSADLRIWREHIAETRAHIGKSVAEVASIAHMVVSLLEHYCYSSSHLGENEMYEETLTAFVYGGITS